MSNREPIRTWIYKNLEIVVLPLALISLVFLMGSFNPSRFYSAKNATAMAFQVPELGLFSMAMMIAMITGGINLSIISTANLSNVLMALALTQWGAPDSEMHVGLVLLIVLGGLIFSAFLGMINGVLIAYAGVSAVLTTVGTMIFYEGLTLAITKGYVLSGFPPEFLAFGNKTWLGVPIPFFLFISAAFVLWLIFRGRPFGRQLFLIGSNKTAVEYSGIDVKMALVKAYMLSGVYAGLAGVVMLSRFNSANARCGVSYLLASVLVAVLGGTDPDGGRGRISGLVLALFTLQVLTSGLNLMKVSSFVTIAFWGVLLVFVIAYRRFAVYRRDQWMTNKAREQK